jgi:hypothetical protein
MEGVLGLGLGVASASLGIGFAWLRYGEVAPIVLAIGSVIGVAVFATVMIGSFLSDAAYRRQLKGRSVSSTALSLVSMLVSAAVLIALAYASGPILAALEG